MRFLTIALVLLCAQFAAAQDLAALLKSEADRVAVVDKVRPTVVAVFANGGKGGGSGVLINDEGYALTNFHVVQPAGPTMQCGLADGVLYDAVLVGLDKVGDVALIKLLPKKDGAKFPFAVMGDSDTVREGDWSIAMGNPFLLATDFTPTVTFGLVSGVHRYQYPAGTFLEYTDCIQIDTSINPGNSGGPLYNMKGELIGINGRGSFDKRGRVNSGVGYAISMNQIKNFLGHMRAGLDTDHATLGAVVTTQTERSGVGRMEVTSILEDSDVARRGLDLGDEILSFGGRTVSSVNHFKNVLGLYPRGWRMPLEFRREQVRKEVLVRLMGVQQREISGGQPVPQVEPKKIIIKGAPGPQGPAAKLYQPKPGFANYYFNKVETERLMTAFHKHGEFKALAGNWSIEGTVRLKKLRTDSKMKIDITEEKEGGSIRPMVSLRIGDFDYTLQPIKDKQEPEVLKMPESSGGLLSALYLYRLFLTQGEKSFPSEFYHGGYEPFYPPPVQVDEKSPPTLASLRVDTEVIHSRLGNYLVKWFFARGDQKLLGMEVRLQDNEDPCEVYFSDYRAVDGRMLPHRMQVLYGNGHYGTFAFSGFQLAAK
jgi:serine protease Do